ncbi:SIR2 family protein [Citrobacter freundii]|uniref:SIR2 family protein n=1 Tax=Citrobacter freundii TaxID=546 RepID=UPI0019288A08|nr:SIR2 family protein [Citrobacter freundii]CAD5361028.1 SIR2_2 domain-containing protein [Citrobacter freundii]
MAITLYEYKDLVKSLVTDIKRSRSISFLIGSAMSYDNGKGCPNVSSMLKVIKEYLSEIDMLDQEALDILNLNNTDAYQNIYEYIFKTGGNQEDIKILMSRYMDIAKNKTTSEWELTTGICDFAKYVSAFGAKVNNVLTTNFDPFIEVALENSGKSTLTHSLEYNSNINSVLNINLKNINILHLHGYFENDTMHTKSQLESVRPKVKESIKSILSTTSSLYVLGYGGWDDIFIKSLEDIVEEFDASYNIRWAFYSESDGDILHNSKKILDIVSPAIAKGRFHPYKGVDCHKLFSDVNSELLSVNNFEKDITLVKKNKDTDVSTININDVFNPKAKKIDDKLVITPYDLPTDKSHDLIRLFEQYSANKYLSEKRGFVLESGWGYGKFGFLSSIILSDDEDKIIVRTDFAKICNRCDAELKIIDDIGLDISTLLALSFKKPLYIIIDNIDNPDASLLVYLNEISTLVSDAGNSTHVIFITNKTLQLSFETIVLKPLDIDDIKEYISNSSSKTKLQGNEIDKLYVLTSGIPAKLDKVQEYQALGVMPLSDILEEELIEVSPERLTENVPLHLLELVDSLENSANSVNKRLFHLLTIFSVLECGESVKNIKKHFYENNFKIDDFSKLLNMTLVKSITKEDHRLVVLKINPLIKDYIISKMTEGKINSIVHNSMGLIYGEEWSSISIRINPTIKSMQHYQDFFPGNAHILTIHYLKYSLQNNLEIKPKLIKICVAYCMYLINKDRFKELASFSESVYNITKHSDLEERYDILYYYSESMRMIDNEKITVSLLKNILNEDREKLNISNFLYNKLFSTYMLALSATDEKESLTVATKLLDLAPRHSSAYYQAQNIIISASKFNKAKILNLKKLERQARKDGCTLVANNICLELVVLLKNENDKYLKSVLDTEDSTYTRIRALLTYARKLLDTTPEKILSTGILPSIVDAYRYLFLQRIALFDKCHDLIWDVFKKFARFPDLYQIYRTSSILWRLNGDASKEYKYASDLIMLANSGGNDEVEYVNFVNKRFKYLEQNKEILKIEVRK